ncbi:MAG TPA: hypothetical protein VMR06_14275, partial [Dokdonella sp.]|uniref:hypothetical protein n=1 Tax=Dokdonella sp. TaxID=2291710 RepID=UPI002C0A25D1
ADLAGHPRIDDVLDPEMGRRTQQQAGLGHGGFLERDGVSRPPRRDARRVRRGRIGRCLRGVSGRCRARRARIDDNRTSMSGVLQ